MVYVGALIVCITIYLLVKQYETRMVLFGSGLLMASLALKPLAWSAVPKFALVSLVALGGSFLFAWVVRLIPPLRRVFS